MPKVSILIPTFNMASFLPVAIESCLVQDYADKEIIVVDDGSTDGTEDVIRPYLPHIRYQRQENQGLVASLNRGMEMAEGEYVRFLDADDAACADGLSAQVEQLSENSRVGLVFGQDFVIDSHGEVLRLDKPFPAVNRPSVISSPRAFRWLLRGCGITKSTVMIRRATFARVGRFQPKSWPGEDWDMWLRIAAYYDLAYVPAPLAYRRVHPGSITAGYTLGSFRASHLHTLETLFSRPGLPYPQLEGLAYACLERNTARLAAHLRRRRLFVRHFLAALSRQPRLLVERETWSCYRGGLKLLLPPLVLRAARRLSQGSAARRGLLGQRAKQAEHLWVREAQQRLRTEEKALERR